MTPDLDAADRLLEVHEIVGFVVLGLIGLHVAAALYHHFLRRDDTVLSMLPSRGRGAPGRGGVQPLESIRRRV